MLVGRVQYGYGDGAAPSGTWNEWHLALFDDGGKSGWLSEDNDQLRAGLRRAAARTGAGCDLRCGPAETQARRSSWPGLRWSGSASIVQAGPLAAQGELPIAARRLGSAASRSSDLRNEQCARSATLDYADPAEADAGRSAEAVRLESLQLQGLREDPDWPRRPREPCIAAQQFRMSGTAARTVEVTRTDHAEHHLPGAARAVVDHL